MNELHHELNEIALPEEALQGRSEYIQLESTEFFKYTLNVADFSLSMLEVRKT